MKDWPAKQCKSKRKHGLQLGQERRETKKTHETSITPVTGLIFPKTQVFTSVKTKADVRFSMQEAKIWRRQR